MKVTKSGWYKTRDGRLAEVVMMPRSPLYKSVGVIDGYASQVWLENGELEQDKSHPLDLIEYLGKERPKQRKTVKMAPALFKSCSLTNPVRKDGFFVTDQLYSSEEHARKDFPFSLVRWLIDTHSVTVEVDE
jgi:hypothetical protein